ncbi:type II secretion system F family protein [Rhodococcoides yunnanense]|uniref:type II secretion system F family protein n=1 Tax=Rhodococcoides yunnanense TaxID=278209 RepID=UPI0009348196|nr:type II secretion system F family protein [Rhodococcus yunnanensis]
MSWLALACVAGAMVIVPALPSSLGRVSGPHVEDTNSTGPEPDSDDHSAAAVLDLLAACLRGGLPAGIAAAAVAGVAPPSIGKALKTTSDLLVLGADAHTAWAPIAADPEMEPLARMARRSARSGSSLADGIAELARQKRVHAEDAAAAAAERAGVLISGPLGLCFLPAFVCLGIVPVVAGLAGSVLGGGLL